jgi:hypothetical protein
MMRTPPQDLRRVGSLLTRQPDTGARSQWQERFHFWSFSEMAVALDDIHSRRENGKFFRGDASVFEPKHRGRRALGCGRSKDAHGYPYTNGRRMKKRWPLVQFPWLTVLRELDPRGSKFQPRFLVERVSRLLGLSATLVCHRAASCDSWVGHVFEVVRAAYHFNNWRRSFLAGPTETYVPAEVHRPHVVLWRPRICGPRAYVRRQSEVAPTA